MSCLCAPTTHAGSFRCRLHRTNSWGGRGVRPTHGQDLEVSTASLIESSLQSEQQKQSMRKAAAASAPLPPRSPSSRSPPKGGSRSRLRHVVSSSDEDDDEVIKTATPVSERVPAVKMATGAGSAFRMMKPGAPPSSKISL